MWDEPDEFGVPFNMFGYVPEDFIRALGRIVMLSALVKSLLAHLVARTGRLDSEETMTWTAGRLTAAVDRIANVRKLDPRVLEVKAKVRQLLDVRNALVHGMWPFHGGRAPRGWRYPLGRKGDSELDSTEWIEITLDEMRGVVQRPVAVHGSIRDLLSCLDLGWRQDPAARITADRQASVRVPPLAYRGDVSRAAGPVVWVSSDRSRCRIRAVGEVTCEHF